jgi:hypothetical protein
VFIVETTYYISLDLSSASVFISFLSSLYISSTANDLILEALTALLSPSDTIGIISSPVSVSYTGNCDIFKSVILI